MYKVVKDIGASENVYLQNTETMAELNLGRITPKLCKILSGDGYIFEIDTDTSVIDSAIKLKDKWDLSISNEIKEDLRKLAMPMRKPIRDQRKVKDTPKPEKKVVDMLDIIYGLA